MGKVGIITFHRAINYGAILQAIALQKAIWNMGYESEIIDYVDELYEHYKIDYRSSNILKTILKYWLSGKLRLKNRRFNRFLLNNTKISYRKFNRETIQDIQEEQYRLFITGSDQVFNPQIVNYDENYLLNFVKNKEKCNSYAASIGLSALGEKDIQWLSKHLETYRHLLVRERTAQNLLNEIGIFNSVLVADPTVLLNSEEWEAMEKKVKLPKHFILSYGFQKSSQMDKCLTDLALRHDLPIYTVGNKLLYHDKCIHQLSGVGPAEWLYIIHNADYIVTNSFHGMIFSFIFEKQVWVADSNDGTFSRMEDFLTEMSCEDRIITANENVPLEKNIDYTEVTPKLQRYIQRSKKILREMLEDKEYEGK